jgi:hypothetical protein
MRPLPRIKLGISRRNGAGGNPQNRVKRCHRIKATVESEDVLVEVGLQMFRLDPAVMSPLNPSFQVAENEMDHGQVRLCLVWVSTERKRLMAVPGFGKSRIASPAVSPHGSSNGNVLFDKACESFGTSVWRDTKSQSSCIDTARAFLAVVLPRPNLHRADHNGLMMNTATFAARLTADQGLVNLYWVLATNGVTFGANHTGAKLMENLKGGLVARERKLALELNGGLSGDLRGS